MAAAKDQAGERSARYERQRARIVDAAVSLANEKGVSGMTLQQVAQALDLTTTSVTYYYRYKEQLAAHVFEDTLQRLAAMVADAAGQPTPQARVARYVENFFDQFEATLRGRDRPLAILSEMRTLEEAARHRLIAYYQEIFRAVRRLFDESDADKVGNSARAQYLNEALFWAAAWLRRYSLRDLPNVRRRTLDIFQHGIAAARPMPLPPPLDLSGDAPADARHNFLRAASRLINDIGYKGASIDRIASELRLSKGSFYHHLETKDELIEACYREDYDRLARLQAMIDGVDAPMIDRLSRAFASVLAVQFEGTHPFLRTTALQAMPPSLRQAALARYERHALALSGMLVDGMADGSVRRIDPLIAGNIIISTLNSAYDIRGWAGHQRREDAIARYADILLSGLFANDRLG